MRSDDERVRELLQLPEGPPEVVWSRVLAGAVAVVEPAPGTGGGHGSGTIETAGALEQDDDLLHGYAVDSWPWDPGYAWQAPTDVSEHLRIGTDSEVPDVD